MSGVFERVLDVVVVGGGAAGVGVAVALKQAGVREFVVLERGQVGASFRAWPRETRFITPSFPTNSMAFPDLNAVAIGASPGWSMGEEHPTGRAYAQHLDRLVLHFKLPVVEGIGVERIEAQDGLFRVQTDHGDLDARHVVWAAGEFMYPRLDPFPGARLCRHTATLPSYADLEGDEFLVIGGYESGVDAAYHLALRGARVQLLDAACPWEEEHSDPSIALSPFTQGRMREPSFVESVSLVPNARVCGVTQSGTRFEVQTEDGRSFRTSRPPLLASGFTGGHTLVENLFSTRQDGFPLLNHRDESTRVPGAFLVGPSVRHGDQIFCFLYKYRQRFGIVAKAIAEAVGLETDAFEAHYRARGMFLDDLSVCGEDCVC